MNSSTSPLERRVLVLPPTRTDATLTERLLRQSELEVVLVESVWALCEEVRKGAAAVVLTEDSVLDDRIDLFVDVIAGQPVWSDLPVILLAGGGASSPAAAYAIERLGNVILLELPVRIGTLVSTLRVALRDRRRQYETRGYHSELLQQADALWRSNRELEQFAYVSSHDLKEPLRKMLNYGQLLESRFKDQLGPEGERYIRMITESGERMRNLIESLLMFSRIAKTEPKSERIDLTSTLSNVLNDLEVAIREAGATVEVGEMPTLEANPLQLHQLFQNLIANGIKFNAAGAKIQVNCEERPDAWLFSVRDNGIGIDPEYHDRIFNVFARLHGRHQYPGTGVGLAICKKIVEAHGGKIWVESESKKGSTFFFTILKHLPDVSQAGPQAASAEAPSRTFLPAAGA
jgi:signal transduction histidine kinase